mgnify:CR=1 FL=1
MANIITFLILTRKKINTIHHCVWTYTTHNDNESENHDDDDDEHVKLIISPINIMNDDNTVNEKEKINRQKKNFMNDWMTLHVLDWFLFGCNQNGTHTLIQQLHFWWYFFTLKFNF